MEGEGRGGAGGLMVRSEGVQAGEGGGGGAGTTEGR